MSSNTKFRHNKKRNTGLIYEFLVRKISESLIDNDQKMYKKSIDIIKKYYGEGRPIESEKQLFDAVLLTQGVSSNIAHKIVKEVHSHASKLNYRLIDIKKSNLIREIHKAFGKDFFSEYKINHYRAYASMQLLINSCNPKSTLSESVQRIQLEEALISYMQSSDKVETDDFDEVDEVDDFVCSLAIKKFNDRYRNTLSESQKCILKEYINAISGQLGEDNSTLVSFLEKEKGKIKKVLVESIGFVDISSDEKMVSKLEDATVILENMDFSSPTSKHIEEMMLFCKLVEEIKSNE